MRVLYLVPEYPNKGESAAQVRANALLSRLGSYVDLRVIAYPPDGKAVASATAPWLRPVARRNITLPQLAMGAFSSRPMAFRRFDTAEARAILRLELAEFKPDVVHFDTIATMGMIGEALNAVARPKIVAHTHDAMSNLYKKLVENACGISKLKLSLEQKKIARFEAEKLGATDIIVVDSTQDADYLSSLSPAHKVTTLPLGFEPSIFKRPGAKANLAAPAIVFTGHFASAQTTDGADFLVRTVMPLVWTKHPDAHVYLVGAAPGARTLALASDKVHVTGFVGDISAYLRAATVFVCPLKLGSGMRTRVVEALASGVAMVATEYAVRGLSMPAEGAPWKIALGAPQFADDIDHIISGNHDDLRRRAATYAAENYSWDSIARRILEIYQQLLEAR